VFKVPEPLIYDTGAKRICSLQNPEKKMSKSDEDPNSCIYLSDRPEDRRRKFKRAVTDSDSRIVCSPDKPGVTNLITIYGEATSKTVEQVEKEFEGKGYGEFKTACGEAVVEFLRPFREKTDYLLKNQDYLEQVARSGAERAARAAARTLNKVYKKTGIIGF
jgi:tryptophanyl-tRNA synthetase